ncbi:MAG: ion transporter [Phaeodactylibacter sp.]|nr:ion transporter [Phaeodactylibacter sp.]MCB9052256.1 ion transporter [Lewinellaceae bacterium]
MHKVKETIFEIIEGADENGSRWSRFFDLFIVGLITLSILQVILESYRNIYTRYAEQFHALEVIIVVFFTIEYLLRLWTAGLKYPQKGGMAARLAFVSSAMGLIDLLAILPFYMPFLIAVDLRFIRILRVVRLLRVFKLNRYLKAVRIVGSVIMEKRSELSITIFVTFLLLLLSSTIMYYLEGDVQPDSFPNIISTFWWAIATLTTVGYGDVYPVTGWGRLISGIIALLGIGLVALPTGIISAAFVEELEKVKNKKTKPKLPEENYRYCPYCGRPMEEH